MSGLRSRCLFPGESVLRPSGEVGNGEKEGLIMNLSMRSAAGRGNIEDDEQLMRFP